MTAAARGTGWSTLVVFGGTSRIAQEVARAAARDHRKIILVGRHPSRLASVRGDLLARGAMGADTVVCDLADATQHGSMWGELDTTLTDSAAFLLAYGTLGNQHRAEADTAYALSELTTNFVSAAALLTALANRAALGHGGVVAVITSVAGDRARRSNYVYGTAKGALALFTQGLRARLHPQGVRVLSIKPGPVRTPMTRDLSGRSLAEPSMVGRAIYRELVSGHRDVMYVPWHWRWVMAIIRMIPESIAKRLNF